jgi:fumarate reductase subunit D
VVAFRSFNETISRGSNPLPITLVMLLLFGVAVKYGSIWAEESSVIDMHRNKIGSTSSKVFPIIFLCMSSYLHISL